MATSGAGATSYFMISPWWRPTAIPPWEEHMTDLSRQTDIASLAAFYDASIGAMRTVEGLEGGPHSLVEELRNRLQRHADGIAARIEALAPADAFERDKRARVLVDHMFRSGFPINDIVAALVRAAAIPLTGDSTTRR